MRRVFLLALAPTLIAINSAAQTVTIFSDFGPGDAFGGDSGWAVERVGRQIIAASFVPSASASLNSIDVALFSGVGQGTINFALTNDNGGLPTGSVLESFSISGLTAQPAVRTATSVVRPILNSGTKYW